MRLLAALVLISSSAALVDATPKPRWLDQPAWPAGDTLELTWLVSPQVPDRKNPDITKAPLEMIATIGKVSRNITLDNQLGALSPINQVVCAGTLTVHYPLERGEVAKITFYDGGGAGGYLLRREAPDVLALVAWDQDKGACMSGPPLACSRRERAVIQLHVPSDVKVHASIVEVDEHGVRQPFSCKVR